MAPSGVTESQTAVTIPVEQCGEGHPLQLWVAKTGRCQGCDRWVFGNEKVMGCASCNCYYCSTCAPQARSEQEDHTWEEMLSTIGSALRDAERLKSNIGNQVHSDFGRIRSAFNCQSPDSATLSAEQIVVEHAMEQVKTVMSCAGPDSDELQEHEVEIGRSPEVEGGAAASRDSTELMESAEPTAPPSASKEHGTEQTDMLNLSDGVTQEAAVIGAQPKQGGLNLLDDDFDLLDLSDAAPPAETNMLSHVTEATVQEKVAPFPAQQEASLLDISDPTVDKDVQAAPFPGHQEASLLDISDPTIDKDVQAPTNLLVEPAVVVDQSLGVPENYGLLDIPDSTLDKVVQEPAPTQKVTALVDLLDFAEPVAPSAGSRDIEQPALSALETPAH